MRFRAASCALVVVNAGLALAGPPVFEGFDDGAAGWQYADMACAGPYVNPLGTGPMLWSETGGDPGGFITAEDPSGTCFYIRASGAFTGDLSSYRGGTLTYSVFATVVNYGLERGVLLVGTNGVTLSGPLPLPATGVWDRRTITLEASSFRVGTQNGAVASQAQFDAVLSSVDAVHLPAEYGSEVIEVVSVDSVLLRGACVADLAAPFGVLNLFDVLAFLDLFNTQSPVADLAAPAGVLNLFDVLEYLGRYNDGCP